MRNKVRMLVVVSILILSAVLGMLLTVGNTAGDTLYVGPKSTYSNIQDAINASEDGDEIIVANGSYTQNLTIHKDIEIIGNSSVDCKILVLSTTAILVDGGMAVISNMRLATQNDGNDVVKCINGGYGILVNCSLNYTGRFCCALNCDDGMLEAFDCTLDFYKKSVNAANFAWVSLVDTKALPQTVEVDPTSLVEVLYSVDLTVFYEDGTTPIEGANVSVALNGDDTHWLAYVTDYYGGTDDPTDANGLAEVTMMSAEYDGTTTPTWGYNDVKVYKSLPYKSTTREHEEVAIITDVNSSKTVNIVFSSDIRAPDKIENVQVTTINQTIQNVTWDPTAEVGFLNYSVYSTNSVGGNKLLIANTTDEWFEVTGLTADTTYYYVVTVWDAASLESPDSDVASNKTKAVMGTVQGTAKFEAVSRAPKNATVELLDSTDSTIASTIIDEVAYNFTFLDVPFLDGVKVKATPYISIRGEVGVKAGYLENTSAGFNLNTSNLVETVDIVMEYYEKPPDITGKVTYGGGPKDGMNATNVSVELFQTIQVFNATLNETVDVVLDIMNTTTNSTTGEYTLPNVPIGINYTIKVTPRDEDRYDPVSKITGYDVTQTGYIDISTDLTKNLTLIYKQYSDPLVDLIGKTTYYGGDKDGENATNAKVELLTITQEINATTNATENVTALIEFMITDAYGNYSFSIPTGFNYFLRVTPASSAKGTLEVESGYLINETNKFSVVGDTTLNVNLDYYLYVPPLEIVHKAPTGVNVSLDAPIEIGFNYSVSQGVFEMNYEIVPAVSGLNFSMPDSMSMFITHDGFQPGTTYTVTVKRNMTSLNFGRFRDEYTGNTWNFTTVAEPPVDRSITIIEPEPLDVFETDSSITVSGTSKGFPNGTVVTITLGDQIVTALIDEDGNWTAEITAPSTVETYTLTASADGESDQVTLTIEEKKEDDPIVSWGTLSVCIIVFLVLIILALIVVVAVMGFLLTKKRKPKEEEKKEEEEEEEWGDEEEEWEDEDEDDWDDDDEDEDDWDDDDEDEDDWKDEDDDEDDYDDDEDEEDDDYGESEMDLGSMDDEDLDDDWDDDDDYD